MDARKIAIFASFAGFLNLVLLSTTSAEYQGIRSKKIFYRPSRTIKTVHNSDIYFRSVKCTTVTVGYAKISSNILFFPIQAMPAIRYNG